MCELCEQMHEDDSEVTGIFVLNVEGLYYCDESQTWIPEHIVYSGPDIFPYFPRFSGMIQGMTEDPNRQITRWFIRKPPQAAGGSALKAPTHEGNLTFN